MDHIVLNVDDDESMISFYCDVMMLAPERLEEYRDNKVPFPSVRLNSDTIIDLFPKKFWKTTTHNESGRTNMNHFCISLSKMAWVQLSERLEANNVHIDEGPVERWGAHGTGTSIYFKDPEDNVIEARYYENHDISGQCLLGS